MLAASLRRSGSPAGVGRVDVPTTCLRETRDPFCAETAVDGTAGLVDGPFRRIDLDTGHRIPELAPAAVAAAVLAAAGDAERT